MQLYHNEGAHKEVHKATFQCIHLQPGELIQGEGNTKHSGASDWKYVMFIEFGLGVVGKAVHTYTAEVEHRDNC